MLENTCSYRYFLFLTWTSKPNISSEWWQKRVISQEEETKILCQVKLNRWPKMRSNRKYSAQNSFLWDIVLVPFLFGTIITKIWVTIGYYKGYTPSTRVWRTVPTKYVWCVSVVMLKKIILGTVLMPYLVAFAGYGYFNLMAMDWHSAEIHNSSQVKQEKGIPQQARYTFDPTFWCAKLKHGFNLK